MFKEELMPALLKLFQKTQEEERLSNPPHEASVTLTPKPETEETRTAGWYLMTHAEMLRAAAAPHKGPWPRWVGRTWAQAGESISVMHHVDRRKE